MRMSGERQLVIEAFAAPDPEPAPRAARPASVKADAVYGDDFALVRVRDGFYSADAERKLFYVSRGRVYLVRSPRMRAGQGFRRVDGLPAGVRSVDEAEFNPDDGDDQALFAVADCIDGID
jgi:hypothetical protein